MTDVQINTDELRRQRRAHVERQHRLGSVSRRIAWGSHLGPLHAAHVDAWHARCDMLARRYPDADDHVRARRAYRAACGPHDWLYVGGCPTVAHIISVVCSHYGLTHAEILSHRHTARLTMPRHIAMYLARTITLRSTPEIGRRFAGRDHSTILHGVKKIGRIIQSNTAIAAEVEALRIKILGGDNANA